jgi:PIN domain nuclease of toxin-antitoxin system
VVGCGVKVLVDTHALLWWQAGGDRLSKAAARRIAAAEAVLVSPISLWETATLLAKGRIALDRDPYLWTTDLLSDEHVELAPFTATTAIGAGLLGREGFHGDPADRILFVTARELGVPIVTKDPLMRAHARQTRQITTIW